MSCDWTLILIKKTFIFELTLSMILESFQYLCKFDILGLVNSFNIHINDNL